MNIWVILFIVMSVILLAVPFITVSNREIDGTGRVEEESGSDSLGMILLDLEQLDLDLATGKLTPEDHDQMRKRLRQELSKIDHEGIRETGQEDGALS